MKFFIKYIIVVISILLSINTYAQRGARALDCVDAAVISGATSFIDSIDLNNLPTPLYGNTADIIASSTCWGSKQEVFHSWYKFNVGKSGTFEMSITPLNGNVKDWDFILYDITNGCGTGNWIEIACNNSSDCGMTGISTINSMSESQCNLLGTSPWVNTVWLNTNHSYALVINNAGDFDASGFLVFEFATNENNLPDAAELLGLEASLE